MLVGAALVRRGACSPRGRAGALHGGLRCWRSPRSPRSPRSRSCGRSPRRTRGWRPTARSPTWPRSRARWRSCGSRPGAGRRCSHGVALACVVVCGWALLTKVFPGALAARRDVRAAARAVRLLERGRADGGAGRPAAAVAGRAALRPRARPTRSPGRRSALLDVALMLSYSRGALLALLVGLAFWFAVVPLRLRGALPLLTARAWSPRRWSRGRSRTTRSRPTTCRSPRAPTPGTSSARCSC